MKSFKEITSYFHFLTLLNINESNLFLYWVTICSNYYILLTSLKKQKLLTR